MSRFIISDKIGMSYTYRMQGGILWKPLLMDMRILLNFFCVYIIIFIYLYNVKVIAIV